MYAFPAYLKTEDITLVRASGTNLPLKDKVSDVTICWGVLHHMDEPFKGLSELIRVTKPGGCILIFIYSKEYRSRKNLNQFAKNIDHKSSHNTESFQIVLTHGVRLMHLQTICQKLIYEC